MSTKTVYVRPENEEIWKEAEELSNGSLSDFVAEALRSAIQAKQPKKIISSEDEDGFERIELSIATRDPHTGIVSGSRAVAFRGAEIVSWGNIYIYLTPKGNLLFYNEWDSSHEYGDYAVYGSFDEAKSATNNDGEPLYDAELLSELAEVLEEDYVEELDV